MFPLLFNPPLLLLVPPLLVATPLLLVAPPFLVAPPLLMLAPASPSSPAGLYSPPVGSPDWRNVSLPDATPGRHRNVPRLRAMGGDPTSVPPGMQAIWEELWHAMPQSGRVGSAVHTLLRQYRERCQAAMKQPRDRSQSPPALLPVSFAQAKDWLLRQQRAQSESGAVIEEARQVIADLSHSLSEQSTSTAALLDIPARPASLVVPPPVMSVSPEGITESMRAEERYESIEPMLV